MRVRQPLRTSARLLFRKAPLEAQLIITRRCNLSCGYCSEYDHRSPPVPFDVLTERIDAIHRLGVVNTSLLGGEPLMHPNLIDIVAYSNRQNQVSITTNGFLLKETLIKQLNDAGLSNLQISIDTLNTDPTGYIQKSLAKLLPKLELLNQHATFDVHANVVLCESTKHTFKETVDKIRSLGFYVSIGLVHNGNGQIQIKGDDYVKLWDQHFEQGAAPTQLDYTYGRELLQGKHPQWHCRAGSRFLYIDEFGLVQYCSSQRGRLNKPITDYTLADLQAQSNQLKGCETDCSLLCVYRDSMLDNEPLTVLKGAYNAVRGGALSLNGNGEGRQD